MRELTQVLSLIRSVPWAIEEVRGRQVLEMLLWRASGNRRTAEEVEDLTGADRLAREARRGGAEDRRPTGGAVAVLPIFGVISHRAHMVQDVSGPGGTSTELFGQAFRAALGDEQVSAIVLDIDSPGGPMAGVPELADVIFGARGQKPVIAVANSMAASAAYWIASQADELWATPSGDVGSIGVFAVHLDESARLEQEGVRPTIVKAGKFKTESSNVAPLSEEAKAALQEMVDDGYEMFVKAVARGRDVPPGEVRKGFGEGRLVMAKKALAMGMVDRVGTLEEAIATAASRGGRRGGGARAGASAALAPPAPAAAAMAVPTDPPAAAEVSPALPDDLELREREMGL